MEVFLYESFDVLAIDLMPTGEHWAQFPLCQTNTIVSEYTQICTNVWSEKTSYTDVVGMQTPPLDFLVDIHMFQQAQE